MLNTIILIVAAALLSGLLFFEKQGNRGLVLPVKTVLSCFFILTAIVQPHTLPGYYRLILIGLIFCLGGDVFLALPQKKRCFSWAWSPFWSDMSFMLRPL